MWIVFHRVYYKYDVLHIIFRGTLGMGFIFKRKKKVSKDGTNVEIIDYSNDDNRTWESVTESGKYLEEMTEYFRAGKRNPLFSTRYCRILCILMLILFRLITAGITMCCGQAG